MSEAAEIKLSANAEKVLAMVEEMSVLEMADLVKAMEEKFGVSAAAPVAVAAGPATGAGAEAEEAPKDEFTVVLTGIGDKKIQVIKEVRAITGLGLKEAKELVEKAPTEVKEGVSKEEAEQMKAKLEDVGAIIDLK
jgi:large subunit ribosomal protein L7/L12